MRTWPAYSAWSPARAPIWSRGILLPLPWIACVSDLPLMLGPRAPPARARRLERLRKIVPHAERANTATFLEEVIKYIEKLQAQVAELTGQPLPTPAAMAPQPTATASQQPSGAAPTATVGTGLTFKSEPAGTGAEGPVAQDAGKATADSNAAPPGAHASQGTGYVRLAASCGRTRSNAQAAATPPGGVAVPGP